MVCVGGDFLLPFVSSKDNVPAMKKITSIICTGIGVLTTGFSLLYADDNARHKIAIDGDADDWSLVPAVIEDGRSPDAEQRQEVDVQQLKVVNDDENLYIYVATTLPPLTAIEKEEGGVSMSVFTVYLDTDGDASTGCEDEKLIGDNGRKISRFDLKLIGNVGRNAGSLGALDAKDGPFASYVTFAARNRSFSFSNRKKLEEKFSIYRKSSVALCPKGVELALPLEKYAMKPGAKIRLLMHKSGSMKKAVYAEGEYQIPAAK